jgi:cytochrome P450
VTEIRESFQNYDDIKGLPTEKLPYLKAVIEEQLRIFPAVPFGVPRYSPGEMVDGHYIPKGVR